MPLSSRKSHPFTNTLPTLFCHSTHRVTRSTIRNLSCSHHFQTENYSATRQFFSLPDKPNTRPRLSRGTTEVIFSRRLYICSNLHNLNRRKVLYSPLLDIVHPKSSERLDSRAMIRALPRSALPVADGTLEQIWKNSMLSRVCTKSHSGASACVLYNPIFLVRNYAKSNIWGEDEINRFRAFSHSGRKGP